MTTAKLNEAVVKALPTPASGNKLYPFAGAVVQGAAVPSGFFVRVTKDGARAFVMDYRASGRQRRYTIGRSPGWGALAAVQEARKLRQRIDRGGDPLGERRAARAPAPVAAPVTTVGAVIVAFLTSHVDKRLRRPENYHDALERLVVPALGELPIYDLRRSHIAAMLNEIEANNGPTMADRTLSYLSSALNSYANEDDDFAVPRLKGLKRKKGQGRDRVLNDDEIRAVWRAAEANGTFGAVVRFLLLSAQRRGDAFGMTWSELSGATWTIPGERYKAGFTHTVELSGAALAIVEAQPRTGSLVFPNSTGGPLGKGGNRKAALDKAITKANGGVPLIPWTVHDLRRTARSLMSKAGVQRDIAERVLGHAVGNPVERAYDQHDYAAPKRAALEALARLIADILDPEGAETANVVPLRA
jgi:integrase